MKQFQVGLIGYGFSGSTFHAPIIEAIPELSIHKVVSSKPELVRQRLPQAKVVNQAEALWQDPNLELVVITSPNEWHFPLAKAALEAGKHVVVEKPFVIHTEEADELIALAEQKGLILSVYHNRRFDSDFLTIRKCVESGLLGKVHTYEAHYDRYRPEVRQRWREQNVPGSGILYDLGSHLIDQALQLFGFPVSVYADLQAQRPGAEATDYFHVVLHYEQGLRVILHGGCMVKAPGPRYQLHGTLGTLIKHGIDPQEEQLKQGLGPGSPGWGEELPEHQAHLTTSLHGLEWTGRIRSERGCYEKYYEQVAAAIRTGAPNPVPAKEARDVIRLIRLAIDSHEQKQVIACK